MQIKAYTCPSCGAPLDVNYDTRFTFCPHCGCKIHISYEGEAAPQNPDLRQFTASDTGVPLASAEISAGIMDSWEQRSASQSRMSANYSEAVRGVNSYETPSGRTVECSVGADHVYQNRYGDTIGVSGNAVDPEVAAKLQWTELNRK